VLPDGRLGTGIATISLRFDTQVLARIDAAEEAFQLKMERKRQMGEALLSGEPESLPESHRKALPEPKALKGYLDRPDRKEPKVRSGAPGAAGGFGPRFM
jgi:hypothetical protein